jgi:hypothetical protein
LQQYIHDENQLTDNDHIDKRGTSIEIGADVLIGIRERGV